MCKVEDAIDEMVDNYSSNDYGPLVGKLGTDIGVTLTNS